MTSSSLLASLVCHFSMSLAVLVYEDMELSTLVEVGDTVELKCDYHLDTTLYSIKWYRDNVEFFRYIPSEEPHTTVFIVPGMELVDSSSPTNIILNNVGPETGGLFKCEVSEGPPRFSTAARTTNLEVVDLPNSGPAIYGLKSVYKVGEFVNLTCESGPSSPVTSLNWYLNSVKVQETSPLVSHMVPVYPLPDRRAISRSSISVLLTEDILSRALEVECSATAGEIYSQSAVVRVTVGHSWRDWAQHFSASSPCSSSTTLMFVSALVSQLYLK